MREVQVGDNPVVPGVSVLVTFLLVIVDIVVLVIYIHHIGRALRVSALMADRRQEHQDVAGRRLPRLGTDGERTGAGRPFHVVLAEKSGVLSLIGYEHLVKLAIDLDATVSRFPALGGLSPRAPHWFAFGA